MLEKSVNFLMTSVAALEDAKLFDKIVSDTGTDIW